jgi:hypothetical protein
MAAYAEYGYIYGSVIGGLETAAGVLEIAAINSEPLPMAEGGLVRGGRGGVIAQIGEKDYDEAVIPMRDNGTDGFVNRIANKIGEALFPAGQSQMALAGTGGRARETHVHFHGPVIADPYSVKEFSRRIRTEIKSEDQRLGAE